MYIKLKNGVPELYSTAKLRADHPDTSFPTTLSAELAQQYGLYTLNVLPAPSYDERTHALQQSALYEVGAQWQMHYSAEPLPLTVATKNVKAERDRLLAETDWVAAKAYETQTAVPQEWLAYRQQLRDLPAQPNFPYDIVWPSKP